MKTSWYCSEDTTSDSAVGGVDCLAYFELRFLAYNQVQPSLRNPSELVNWCQSCLRRREHRSLRHLLSQNSYPNGSSTLNRKKKRKNVRGCHRQQLEFPVSVGFQIPESVGIDWIVQSSTSQGRVMSVPGVSHAFSVWWIPWKPFGYESWLSNDLQVTEKSVFSQTSLAPIHQLGGIVQAWLGLAVLELRT